jgi:hypothetical protein
MIKSESITNLIKALLKSQGEFDPVLRDTKNPFYNSKYAELSGVISATQPTLASNGLVISQLAFSDISQKAAGITTILAHESGEFISETLLLPALTTSKEGKEKYDAQTSCAAITYARRSAYKAIINIAEQDDDGNTAAGTTTQSTQRPATSAPKAVSTTKAAQPPKAEIPTGPAVAQPSQEPVTAKTESLPAGSSDALPTEDELKGLRNNFKLLGDDLASAGLKARRGLPINRLVLAYLLKTTGAPAADKITKTQWATFFQVAGAEKSSEGGIKSLVSLVNEATPQEKK